MIQPQSTAKNLHASDGALMMAFASGDSEGFDLLYSRYSDSIYRFFYYGTHADQILTDELFYDVWMTVVRGRMRYSNEINFKDWLYHAAWARLHDHLRLHALNDEIDTVKPASKQSSVVSITDYTARDKSTEAKEPESDNTASIPSVTHEENGSLVEAVKNLTPDQKEVVLLRYCFSMSNQDIADFIDVSKATVDRISREAASLLRQNVTVAPMQRDQFNG